MFHVKRIGQNRIVKRIFPVLLMIFVFNSCFPVKSNPEIADYHILNSVDSKELKKNKPAIFMFENKRMQRSFQTFLGYKLNQKNENRDFKVKIQSQDFVISVLDQIEVEKFITLEDFVLKRPGRNIVKDGEQKNYVAITVTDKIGNDCLKNNSIYQNLVLNYLKELKLEYSTP